VPNLLAHYGAQGPVLRALLPRADLRWILLGCVLPDAPWILQRLLVPFLREERVYELRLFAVAQASLAGCLLLSASVCFLSKRPALTFGVLSLGAVFHLFLDAVETKWGNGVHLFVPFSFGMTNFGLFWPESAPIYLATVAGLAFVFWELFRTRRPTGAPARGRRRPVAAAVLLGASTIFSCSTLRPLEQHDAHFVRTLRNRSDRSGRLLELDRARWTKTLSGDRLVTFAGEPLRVRGTEPREAGIVSVRGRFLEPDLLEVSALHEHRARLRDAASYAGLLLLGAAWLRGRRPVGAEPAPQAPPPQ